MQQSLLFLKVSLFWGRVPPPSKNENKKTIKIAYIKKFTYLREYDFKAFIFQKQTLDMQILNKLGTYHCIKSQALQKESWLLNTSNWFYKSSPFLIISHKVSLKTLSFLEEIVHFNVKNIYLYINQKINEGLNLKRQL